MYLIVDKAKKTILHMSNAYPGQEVKPQDLLPSFDAQTMDFGISPGPYIPVRFSVEDGVVKDLDAPPALNAAAAAAANVAAIAGPAVGTQAETIDQARARRLREFTDQALWQRSQLIPDYQLLNAGLGLYDAARVQSMRATVQAFRQEVQRLEKAAAKAKTVKALDALQPQFPQAVIVPKPAAT